MSNGLQLPFQATSQGPGDAFSITSNVVIQSGQTIAAISAFNTGPVKIDILKGAPHPIGVLGDSSKNAGIGVQGNGGMVGVEGISAQGTGVVGKGPTAGFFDGNVTVTGTLVVGSTKFTDLMTHVQTLQTTVQTLQTTVQQLQTQVGQVQTGCQELANQVNSVCYG